MSGKERRPGDPYEVGYAKPPKKPDLYTELSRVLQETVTVTIDGEAEQVSVQHALLMRLRAEALRGEVWAQKLLHRVVDAIPQELDHAYDHIEQQVGLYRARVRLGLISGIIDPESVAPDDATAEASDGE